MWKSSSTGSWRSCSPRIKNKSSPTWGRTRDEPPRTSSWEAKTNPNFQLVNKPPQGSITAVKKFLTQPLFVTKRVRAFNLYKNFCKNYKTLRKNHLRDPTTISWPVSLKISEDSWLLILRVPFTFADLCASIGPGTEHTVFPVLHLIPYSARWRGHIVIRSWDTSGEKIPD